jgi:hypothetical protein
VENPWTLDRVRSPAQSIYVISAGVKVKNAVG